MELKIKLIISNDSIKIKMQNRVKEMFIWLLVLIIKHVRVHFRWLILEKALGKACGGSFCLVHTHTCKETHKTHTTISAQSFPPSDSHGCSVLLIYLPVLPVLTMIICSAD